jgi:NAD(P)-dependent dehydrogenase (short-subunit alcohol dehydrogenase family)
MDLQNSTAVVTGASTGIGRTISIALAKIGVKVFLVARNNNKLKETKKLIDNFHGKAEIKLCDLSEVSSIHDLVNDIKKTKKKINILVNVAGIWHGKDEVYASKDFELFSEKVILDTYNVGIVAPTLLSHSLIPYMPRESKIINISGTFESGAKGWLPYYVSKRAIEDLTIGLSQEVKDKGITVNAISPSDTATEEYKKYFPQFIQDAISPEEIAKQVISFCYGEDRDKTGQVIVIKKGEKPFKHFHK